VRGSGSCGFVRAADQVGNHANELDAELDAGLARARGARRASHAPQAKNRSTFAPMAQLASRVRGG